MPGFEKSSETIENRAGRPRVGGLFGGFDQPFQRDLFDDLNANRIHWRAKYAEGDYCSGLLDHYAQQLMDWFDEAPNIRMAIVVSDTPAALAALRARGDREIHIVIGVSGNPALDDVFSEFRVTPVNVEEPPRTHSVLDEESAAAKRLGILLHMLDPEMPRNTQFTTQFTGRLEAVPNLLDERGAGWENTIVIVTNYSNPGWEREVEETYEAANRYNFDPQTALSRKWIRLLHRGVSCHYPTNPQGHVEYNVQAVVRNLGKIQGLKGLLVVGDAASRAYRDRIIEFAQGRGLPSAWETAAVLGPAVPGNERGTLCWAAPRDQMWRRAGQIARILAMTGAHAAPLQMQNTSRLFVDSSIIAGAPPIHLAGEVVNLVP